MSLLYRASSHVQLSRTSGTDKETLHDNLCVLADAVGRFSIGSACSGTNVFCHSYNCNMEEWKELTGVELPPFLCFTCEKEPWKRDFSDRHWDFQYHFEDIECLGTTPSLTSRLARLLFLPQS